MSNNSNVTVNAGNNLTLAVDGLAGPTNVLNTVFSAAEGMPVYNDGSTLPTYLAGQTYTWGPINIALGNGTDVVYGDLYDLTLAATNCPYIASPTGIEPGVITDETFIFASSTISLGNGNNDVIYGNLHSINLIAEQGSSGGEIGGIGNGQNLFTFGSNTLSEGNGNSDTIYGNVGDVNLTGYSGATVGGWAWAGSTPPGGANDFSFGTTDGNNLVGNTLMVGNGNFDTLYGSMHDLTLSMSGFDGVIGGQGGDGSDSFSFGANTLTAGNGNGDQLYGTLHDVNNVADGVFVDIGGLVGGFVFFTFSGNTIIAGNGSGDQLYGTLHDINNISNGDFVDIGGLVGGLVSFVFGNNTLIAGNGVNDTLYGSMHNMTESAAFQADAIGGAFGGEISYSFGNNSLSVGNGANDTLYGTLQDMDLIGSNGGAIGGIVSGFGDYEFGNNTLMVGNGTNDTLYGTMHDMIMVSTGIDGLGHPSQIGGVSPDSNFFIFGNNTLTAGNGNDTLYGSMHDLQLVQDSVGGIQNNIIQFGTNVLNAGTGNDTLVGELNNIDFPAVPANITGAFSGNIDTLANLATQFLANNTIISGQNTFNLHGPSGNGAGVDTLVFDPAIDIGINIVNHFHSNTDMLEFHNVLPTGTETVPSLADLENLIASITSDGHNGTLVTFKQVVNDQGPGGTIDFVNNAYNASHTTIDQHLTDLVNNQLAHIKVLV